jgi:hypothetical protein
MTDSPEFLNKQHQSDHDLLIRIDEKLELFIKDKKDHEIRLRRLEMWGAIAVGLSYATQFYFNFLRT